MAVDKPTARKFADAMHQLNISNNPTDSVFDDLGDALSTLAGSPSGGGATITEVSGRPGVFEIGA